MAVGGPHEGQLLHVKAELLEPQCAASMLPLLVGPDLVLPRSAQPERPVTLAEALGQGQRVELLPRSAPPPAGRPSRRRCAPRPARGRPRGAGREGRALLAGPASTRYATNAPASRRNKTFESESRPGRTRRGAAGRAGPPRRRGGLGQAGPRRAARQVPVRQRVVEIAGDERHQVRPVPATPHLPAPPAHDADQLDGRAASPPRRASSIRYSRSAGARGPSSLKA